MQPSTPRAAHSGLRLASSLRLLAVITLGAFTTETLIMLVLPTVMPHQRIWLDALLDSALLVCLLLPTLYFFMMRPLEIQIAVRRSTEERLTNLLDTAVDAVLVLDQDTRFTLFNQGAQQIFGYRAEEVLGQPLDLLLPTSVVERHRQYVQDFARSPDAALRMDDQRVIYGRRKDGSEFPAEASISKLQQGGRITYTVILHDITHRKAAEDALLRAHAGLEQRVRERTSELAQANEALQSEVVERQQAEADLRLALAASRQREAEIAALLEGSRAVLAYPDFDEAARAIFDACKGVLGAAAGYVALLTEDGGYNQPVFLDTGERDCTVDPSLPMPIRGLRERAYRTGQTVYENDFQNSAWTPLLPNGHARLENVLFAPLILHGKTAGVMGLANKLDGFTNNDARLASAFGELAAIALLNSRTLKSLEDVAAEAKARADVLDTVFAAITDAVIVYDAGGSPLRANPAAVSMLGAAPRRLSRMQFFAELPLRYPGGRVVPWDNVPSSRALRGETTRDECLVLTNANGSNFTILASASPLSRDDQIWGVVAVWHDITEHERLSALEERQRLARELHDSLSQALYGIALGAHTIREFLDADRAKVVEALDYVLALADAGLTEMRALIFDLRPESLEIEGLVKALTKQAAAVRARYSLETRNEFCEEPDLPLETKEALYRIAQEALHNTVKHACAKRLNVRLCRSGERIVLEVSDDGVGFDPQVLYPGHLGLNSMRERVKRMGGQLEIDSAPGRGARIHAEFPLFPAAAKATAEKFSP